MRDVVVSGMLIMILLGAIPSRPALGADPAPADGDTPLTEITFERTRCYGPCPAYKVTLRPDGTVTYVGEAHVERLGRHEGRVGRGTFKRLASLMEAGRFFDMKDQYTTHVADHATVITTATRAGGERKTVSNYAETGPIELWGIEMAIDGVLSRVSWTTSDKSDKPAR